MDVRYEDMGRSMHREDVAQPVDGMELGSEVDVTPPPTELNVAQSKDEQPLPSLVETVVDAAAEP